MTDNYKNNHDKCEPVWLCLTLMSQVFDHKGLVNFFYWCARYTITPVSEMNMWSSVSPYTLQSRYVSVDHIATHSCLYPLHLWRIWSTVRSSSPHGQVGDCLSLYFLYMCEFSLLCHESGLIFWFSHFDLLRWKCVWPNISFIMPSLKSKFDINRVKIYK